jgi:ribosomal protein S18 acetylase RimI-like enzyme
MTLPRIEWLTIDEAAAFAHHLRQHLADNGAHGQLFSPIESHELQITAVDVQRRAHATARGLLRPVDKLEWRRAFVVRDPSLTPAEIFRRPDRGLCGHVDLRGAMLPSALHRATLAMGLYASARAQGHGRRLLDAALAWLRQQPSLVWVDLTVFSHNAAALHLYRQAGFIETGRTVDRYRVQGSSIDEIQLSLRLRP